MKRYVYRAAPLTKAEPDEPTTIKAEDEATIIEEGLRAFERRKAANRTCWQDWLSFGKAIQVGHEKAKRLADGKTKGNRYSAVFHHWLEGHRFLDLDKVIDRSDRTKLIWLVNNLEKVEAWRKTRTEAELAEWNHPSTVYRICHCKDRGLPEFREKTGEPSSTREQPKGNGACVSPQRDGEGGGVGHQDDPGVDAHHDDDGAHQENGGRQTKKKKDTWDPVKLMLAANKAMGHIAELKLKGGWSSPEPPNRALVVAWWELARAVANIANVLDEASGLSENLPLKVRCKREVASTPSLTEEERAERALLS